MTGLAPLLDSRDLVAPLDQNEAELVARELAADSGLAVYAKSIAARDGRVYFLGKEGPDKRLCIMGKDLPEAFDGEAKDCPHGLLKICPRTPANAAALRRALPFTAPIVLGDRPSIGTGDRLGLATPGHIRAVRGTGIVPVLAQQSMREMSRTHRSPQEVMDDATWGVFEEGYRDGFGADADHLKTTGDIDATFAAGFRMFTVDPGQYVDNAAQTDSTSALRAKLADLPWADLETTPEATLSAFAGRTFEAGIGLDLAFTEEDALRAAAKYGRAIAHTKTLYRHLSGIAEGQPFDLEMSVDETDSPTTVHEHFYVAHELDRLGVKVAGLAPRFVGDFEKGIDYKGALDAFEASFVRHVKIAKHFGKYKISIHSGSDKFSIYPIAAKHAGPMAHVKTAGTSYLEALRAVGQVNAALFREILAFAFDRYDEDKASYHVSAKPETLPRPEALKDGELDGILDINDGRQLLHVTYGSVLTARDEKGAYRFRDRIYKALRENEETHYDIVAAHLRKHAAPFAVSR